MGFEVLITLKMLILVLWILMPPSSWLKMELVCSSKMQLEVYNCKKTLELHAWKLKMHCAHILDAAAVCACARVCVRANI
jgi:hypothetical protein